MMYALILAGGVGSRLWPLSRTALPKQLLAVTGERTMIQATIDRVLPIMPIERILVATNRVYGPLIHQQAPGLPRRNIIEEPNGKNTAPCIGLGAAHIRQLDPNSVMASLHADHYIANEEAFRQALMAAAEVARQGYLVTLGITPNKPETGYGYVQRGVKLGEYNHHPVYQAARFLEKPRLATAERFVAGGEHYWNSGIFVWQLSTLLQGLHDHLPELYEQINQIEQALNNGSDSETQSAEIEAIWQGIQAVSIDVGLMQRANNVAVIPVDFGWNDVGSWAAIYEINGADKSRNVVLGTEHVTVGAEGVLIRGNGKLIATIGLKDVIYVETDDAVLICAKEKAQEVKEIVSWLEDNGRTDLL